MAPKTHNKQANKKNKSVNKHEKKSQTTMELKLKINTETKEDNPKYLDIKQHTSK